MCICIYCVHLSCYHLVLSCLFFMCYCLSGYCVLLLLFIRCLRVFVDLCFVCCIRRRLVLFPRVVVRPLIRRFRFLCLMFLPEGLFILLRLFFLILIILRVLRLSSSPLSCSSSCVLSSFSVFARVDVSYYVSSYSYVSYYYSCCVSFSFVFYSFLCCS